MEDKKKINHACKNKSNSTMRFWKKTALRFDVIQLIVDSRESSFSIENASKTLKLLNFIRIVNRLLKDCTVKEDAIFERKPFLLVRKRAAINNGFKVFTKFHSINHYPISVFMRNFLSPTWENQIGSIFKLNIKKKVSNSKKKILPCLIF